ncbi:MAG: hypothetical protein IJM83_12690 [Firmicutes bacterium]|nr:hypothetical protein [Lachnospiraceae bacterium]MBQ7060135.1 hypothetical protein [Bacillota bacterium]
MKKEKRTVLYGGFFPFYGMMVGDFSNLWWMLILNVLALVIVSYVVLTLARTKPLVKTGAQCVGRAFLVGILGDAVGLLLRFLPLLLEMLLRLFGADRAAGFLAKRLSDFTWFQIWNIEWNHIGLPWTIGCILAAGVFDFLLLYKVVLKKLVPKKKVRLVLSILLALVSMPSSWTNPAW